jgi:UDP-N-acetylmuramate--alanine ligase
MDDSRAHLIGISGNGMRALADVLLGWGWTVTGSDLLPSPFGRGAGGEGEPVPRFVQGHSAKNVPPHADIVIYSDAIPSDNPELLRATALRIPALSYFQALGKITSGGHTIAIAGTHGKSTTTAMIGHILTEAGLNPTVFCGAAPIGKTSGGRAGRRDFSVVEACEYRRNFLHLRPTHAAILGVESDHFDCFQGLADIETAFRQFAVSLPADGLLLYGEDCPATQKVVQRINCRKLSFGLSPTADWSAQRLRHEGGYYRFSIFKLGELIVEVKLPVPGRYNALNALAAAAMCLETGVSPDQIAHGLESLPGLHRRFEITKSSFPRSGVGTQFLDAPASKESRTSAASLNCSTDAASSPNCVPTPERGNEDFAGRVRNLSYVTDYAHHPTEVAVALETAREVFPDRRIWCIFQPHQASRTARLLDELAISLQNADKVIVADIFRAREGPPKPGEVTAADLARRVAEIANSPLPLGEGPGVRAENDASKVIPVCQTDDIKDALATQLRPGDVIITLGAGDIHSRLGLGPQVLGLKIKDPKPKSQDPRQRPCLLKADSKRSCGAAN